MEEKGRYAESKILEKEEVREKEIQRKLENKRGTRGKKIVREGLIDFPKN